MSMQTTDPQDFGRVAVLLGGVSSEREVSLNSGQNCLDALRRRGVDAHPVDGVPALLAEITAKRCDRVFNILHGGDGEQSKGEQGQQTTGGHWTTSSSVLYRVGWGESPSRVVGG